jgi:eukaryotic-like serine/threonine-protein kinase
MSSLDTPSPSTPARAALVSPGAALVPLDSEAKADYLQERIGLLAQLFCALGTFFLVAGITHRHIFVEPLTRRQLVTEPALLIHLGVLGFQAAVWLTTRRRFWSEAMLPSLDAGLVLATLGTRAYQATHLNLGVAHHAHLVMVLTTFTVLLCRAVTVPSKPATTLAISALGVIPALSVAIYDGAARGLVAELTSLTSIWCVAAVALPTFASKVIYGLRESVGMAQQLGQYVIERKLGEGGMGEVYLARHTLLRRHTALKLLPPERAGAKTVARFEREVRATSRLSHPNTVAIYDYGRTREGIFYYAMEYLDGMDLQRLVQEQGPLEPARVIHILAQIAGALDEAHHSGLVHRDLKPANVYLCERGGLHDTVKVLDFGLVKETGGQSSLSGPVIAQTDVNALVGTPTYLSPESIHSPATVDARSDLYAVGAIGYFLLTGTEVFQGSSLVALCIAHLHEQPQRPSDRVKRPLPSDLEQLILSCLDKDPARRPSTAAALRQALLACDVPSHDPERRTPVKLEISNLNRVHGTPPANTVVMSNHIAAACCTAIALSFSTTSQAQVVDSLASTSVEYYPASRNGEIPGETQLNVFRASAGVPIPVAKRTQLVAGAAYEMIDVRPSGGESFQLHAPKATVGVMHGFNDTWGMMAFTDAGAASDFSDDLGSNDLLLSLTLIGTYALSDSIKLGAGAVYDRRTGKLAPLPALLLDWRVSERVRVRGFAPTYVKADYHALEWLDLGLRATFEGNRFHLGQKRFELENVELAYSNLTVGPKLTFNFSDWTHLDLYAAGAIYRRYEVFQNDDSLAKYELSPTVAGGVRFWVAPSEW